MIHVKMLDKDGVGFRHITVENPACIQLIASDPEIGDYPILRVGREAPNIVNYPLTNDAYIMSETGATISKINFKDCLREAGKEEGGWRPARRGLKDLMPFNEINRNAVKTLFLKMPVEREAYVQSPEPFPGRKSPYEPYLIDVDADINVAEEVGNNWVFSINGKLRNVADFPPEDLSKMRVAYPHRKRKEFIEDLAASKNSIEIQDFKDCVSVLSRNTRLHEYHLTVLGGTLKSAELFTPIIFDKELGGGPHVMIKGVKTSLDHVTMGDVLMHNMFFMEPLLVDQKTIEQDPAVIKQLMMASTVFFYANPDLRTDVLKTQEWIDYAYTEEKKGSSSHAPLLDRYTCAEELPPVKENESLEMLSSLSNDLKGAFHEKVKECFDLNRFDQVIEVAVIKVNVGIVVKEAYDNIAIVVDGEVVWVANASGLVSDVTGHGTYLLKGPHEVTWFEIIPSEDCSVKFFYKNIKESKSKAVFYSKSRILEIGTPCAVSNMLEDGEDIRQVTVERVHFKATIEGKEVEFSLFTGQYSNNTFAPSVMAQDKGIYALNMVVQWMPLEAQAMSFLGYVPLLSFTVCASHNTKENKLVISGNKVKVDGLAESNGRRIHRGNATRDQHEIMNYFANGEVTQVDVKVISN